jgi:hypothetical protein
MTLDFQPPSLPRTSLEMQTNTRRIGFNVPTLGRWNEGKQLPTKPYYPVSLSGKSPQIDRLFLILKDSEICYYRDNAPHIFSNRG